MDVEFGKSDLLTAIAPIRLISIGGFLAVKLFKNRDSTVDIDVLIDPNVDAVPEYRDEVWRSIRRVSKTHGFVHDWVNDQLRIFLRNDLRENLFLESIRQNVLIYAGKNLEIYAGRLDFALERKLRRVAQRSGNRNLEFDLSDALAIIDYLVSEKGHPLAVNYCMGLDENGFGLGVERSDVEMVAARYLAKYGAQGIVDMAWDEKERRWYYEDLEGNYKYV